MKKIKPNKRWTFKEIATICNYLIETGNIEQPTAQIYYRKFLAKTQLKASWDLVKWKVRYLKNCYHKAEKWLQSLGPAISIDDKDKLKKICPHFEKLRKIFGENINVDDSETITENSGSYPAICTIKTLDELKEKPDEPKITRMKIQAAYSLNDLRANSPNQSADSAKVTSTAKKCKKSPISSGFIAALTRSQKADNKNQRLRMIFEKEKFFKEFEFNKEKFKIETELRREEIELKRFKIQREDKLKILEMECNERIAKYELDLKYRRSRNIKSICSRVDDE